MIELVEADRGEGVGARMAALHFCQCEMNDPCPVEVKIGMALRCTRAQLLAHKEKNPKCVLTRQRLFDTIRD